MAALRVVAALALFALLAALTDAVSPSYPTFSTYAGKPYTVSYDRRSLRLNDQPVAFLSGSIHYPRSTPAMWPQLMKQAAADGLNMIEIYVFWNYHQMTEDAMDWSGRGNLTLFLDAIAEAGLFANLRIGPYVCAEWDYGGIPTWLAYKPDMRFRAYNQGWMSAVTKWFQLVVDVTRDYYADRGGPIVLAQVENELNYADQKYVDWSGELAASMDLPIPWIMCNGAAANNTINTCNGNDCVGFLNSNGQSGRILLDQPALWTENEGWFESWGDSEHPEGTYSDRAPDEIAYTVARWFARGGSHMNYYMYHGGNHYDRSAAAGLTNMYANGVNLHADGLPNEPKHTHLSSLHYAIAQVSGDVLVKDAQYKAGVTLPWRYNDSGKWSNGTDQVAFVYGDTVFVENNAKVYLQVQYQGKAWDLAAYSMLIVQGGKVLFNTSAVQPVDVQRVNTAVWDAPLEWQVWSEGAYGSSSAASVEAPGLPAYYMARPVEQLNLTQDLTEYCWYATSFTAPSAQSAANLTIDTATAQSFVAFLDGAYVGTCYNPVKSWPSTSRWQCSIAAGDVGAGAHTLSLLSSALGIENGMVPGEVPYANHYKGIRSDGRVMMGELDLTSGKAGWTLRPYLTGEFLSLPSADGHGSVPWSSDWRSATGVPVTWYSAVFPAVNVPTESENGAPGVPASVLLDMTGFTRGHAYVNGHDIGRYWLIEGADGKPTQSLYHVPVDWLVSGEEAAAGAMNRLTVLEEVGSVDATQVRLYVSRLQAGGKQQQEAQAEKVAAKGRVATE